MPRAGGDHHRTPARLPPRTEHPVPIARSPAAIDLQTLDGLRRPQRRRTPLDRSDISADRVTETVGPDCGADVDAALVRDRAADARGEPRRADGREPRRDRTGRDVGPIRSEEHTSE